MMTKKTVKNGSSFHHKRPRRLWPETVFAGRNSIDEQIAHIVAEIDEADEAGPALPAHALLADPHLLFQVLPLLRELADVQASIETLWNILDREFGDGFSEAMVLGWVEGKNRGRGYYGEKE